MMKIVFLDLEGYIIELDESEEMIERVMTRMHELKESLKSQGKKKVLQWRLQGIGKLEGVNQALRWCWRKRRSTPLY